MEIKEIITELEKEDGDFPVEAIREALAQKEAITPHLLSILENTIAQTKAVLKREDYFGYIYAMFLLAQFREAKAYPLVIKFFSLPEEITWELTGDILTEDLGRILASVSNGDIEPLKEMIGNSELEEMVRAAALDAFLILMISGEVSRETVISYFRELLQGKLDGDSTLVWNHLAVSCVNLYPEELLEDLKTAYAKELVDGEFISFEQVEEAYASGKEEVLEWLTQNPEYTLITDAIADIGKWIS